MDRRILVLGATGKLGEPVARKLLEDGFKVRVFSRNINSAKKQLGEDFEYIQGDVRNLSSIESAVKDCWGIHFSLRGGFTQKEYEQVEYGGLINTINAAHNNGIKRFAYLSIAVNLENARWFFMADVKFKSEKAIINSGLPYTIFSATSFIENFPQMIRNGKALTIGKNPHQWHFISADDFAGMVSNSFKTNEAANKKFYILGPEAVTIKQGLKKYLTIAHPEIKKISTIPIRLIYFIGMITFNRELKFLARLMIFFEREREAGDPGEANRILGTPHTTIEEWAKKHINY